MKSLLAEFREAVKSNDLDRAKSLLDREPAIASSGEYHPLYDAAVEGNLALARLLLDYGADVDMPPQRSTGGAIHEAVVRKHYDIANLLYDHGAAVDSTPDACTPTIDELYFAAMEAGGSPELVRIGFEDHLGPAGIQEPGADSPEVVKLFARALRLGGKPTLSSVVRQENHGLLRDLLVNRPMDPAQRYDSPPGTVFRKIVDAASWLGYPEILELCREMQPELYDADVARSSICRAIGSHNRDGCHREYYRLMENQLRFLKDRAELDHSKMVPLHWLADNFLQSRTYGFKCQQLPTAADLIELAQLFLRYGFDVNYRCPESSKTPLAVAASGGPVEYVRFLIEQGADLGRDDPDETNPVAIAKRKGRDAVVALLERGK